jgi:hypothetical protein
MSSVITRLLLLLPLWRAGGGLTRFNRPIDYLIPRDRVSKTRDYRKTPTLIWLGKDWSGGLSGGSAGLTRFSGGDMGSAEG